MSECPYLNKNVHIYTFITFIQLFKLWLPIPAMSACQSNLNFLFTQNLSKQFLNMLIDWALTIMLGRLFHAAIILLLKRRLRKL